MTRKGIRLLLFVDYEGPWERLMNRFYAIDPQTAEIRREIRSGGLREKLADFCDRRDHAWRSRWTARYPQHPHPRWRRDPG